MVSTKVATVIVNRASKALILKVGNQNCFAKLATIGVGGEHKVEIDVNWTYQEFSVEAAITSRGGDQPVVLIKKVIVSSDDCCDFERITVTESGSGGLQVDKVARGAQFAHNQFVPLIHNWRSRFTWPNFKWRFWM